MSAQGIDVQNLFKIDSAIAALRMREKRGLGVGFLFTYPSIYPFFITPTGHIFSAILTLSAMSHLRFCRATLTRDSVARQNRRCDMALNGSHDVFLQPLMPFGGCDEIALSLIHI